MILALKDRRGLGGEKYGDEKVGSIDCAFLGAHLGGARFCKRCLMKINVVEVRCVLGEEN